ncbi:rubrerythrin family protein [Inconstantimicrobium mannanitabidum]|uniref:Rubrerythrin n=1 Tax=Inconstantimicrobium mannanitabidum TaxID=1604901 RepID=A0ACB5R9I4_9CLOT|nr:rubrerythrin family protein [Clostridium sp. TW13]GKX65702.1 rubrerythrin [Clostridium sp. TW13]
MEDLRGSETEKNLYRTFAVEARTNNLYKMFAEVARKEGYQWVAEVYETVGANELAHSRAAYKKYLDKVEETKENLKFSINREDEVADKYKEYEKIAKAEGFEKVAMFFKELSEAEESHVDIYTDLSDRFENGGIFYSEKPIAWVCMNCGYIHEGKTPPNDCPCCGYPKGYFKPKCDVK